MPDTDELRPRLEKADDTAERMVQHLLRWPCDLIDVRRLMRQFQASATDFQQVFTQLEELAIYSS